jgi:hypothetical protein
MAASSTFAFISEGYRIFTKHTKVYNKHKSIKIATDYISPYRLDQLIKLTDQLSNANRVVDEKPDDFVRDDPIGIEYLLWYAWKRFENFGEDVVDK